MQGNNESGKDGASSQGNKNQEKPTRDKTGEAAEKIYKILLFYWSLIHDNKGIHLVPIAPTVSEEAERESENTHKALKNLTRSVLKDNVIEEEPTLDR